MKFEGRIISAFQESAEDGGAFLIRYVGEHGSDRTATIAPEHATDPALILGSAGKKIVVHTEGYKIEKLSIDGKSAINRRLAPA